MAKPDPWLAIAEPVDLTQPDTRQPDQQAMGVQAPSDSPVGDAAPDPASAPAPANDQFAAIGEPVAAPAQLVDDSQNVGAFGDDPAMDQQASSKLAPEDEAHLLEILRTAPVDQAASLARQFAASKHFAGHDNFDEVVAAREKLGKVNSNLEYHLPEMRPDDGVVGAAGRGAASAIPFARDIGAGVNALEAVVSGDAKDGFGAEFDRQSDIRKGIQQADEADHPVARVMGQLLGGLAIPVGLEGVGFKAGQAALREGLSMAEARQVAAHAVTVRMAKVGGAYSAAHGAGEGDTLSSRVTGALTEGALGVAGGTVAGKIGEAVAPRIVAKAAAARPTPLTDGQQVAGAADRLGMDVLPADVGGATTRRVTSAAVQAPLSASPIVKAAQRVLEQGKAVRDRVAGAIGTADNPEAAGEGAAAGARSMMKSSANRIGRIYDIAGAQSGNIRVPLKNAKAVLDEQITRLKEVPGGGAGLKEAESLRQSLDGDFTVQGIRDMRTEMFVPSEFRGTPVERRMKQIVNAAADDIHDGLVAAGKPEAARTFRAADEQWRERLKTISRVIEPIIGRSEDKAKSGEEIVQGLERAMKGNGRRFEAFVSALPADEASMVRATLISRLGQATKGAQNAEGDAFSLSTFLTHWNTIGERAKSVTFGPESRAAMNDLAKVAQGSKEAQRYANHSNSSGGIWGNLGVLAGGMSVAPGTTTAAGLTQLITGRMMASPKFARWLAKAPRTTLGTPAYIERLGRIARAEPAIANEVLSLQARLGEAFGSAPMKAAASDSSGNEQTPR